MNAQSKRRASAATTFWAAGQNRMSVGGAPLDILTTPCQDQAVPQAFTMRDASPDQLDRHQPNAKETFVLEGEEEHVEVEKVGILCETDGSARAEAELEAWAAQGRWQAQGQRHVPWRGPRGGAKAEEANSAEVDARPSLPLGGASDPPPQSRACPASNIAAGDLPVGAAIGLLAALHADADAPKKSSPRIGVMEAEGLGAAQELVLCDPITQAFEEQMYETALPSVQQLTCLFDAVVQHTSEAHVCAAMRLLARGVKAGNIYLSSTNWRLLTLTSVLLASKFADDQSLSFRELRALLASACMLTSWTEGRGADDTGAHSEPVIRRHSEGPPAPGADAKHAWGVARAGRPRQRRVTSTLPQLSPAQYEVAEATLLKLLKWNVAFHTEELELQRDHLLQLAERVSRLSSTPLVGLCRATLAFPSPHVHVMCKLLPARDPGDQREGSALRDRSGLPAQKAALVDSPEVSEAEPRAQLSWSRVTSVCDCVWPCDQILSPLTRPQAARDTDAEAYMAQRKRAPCGGGRARACGDTAARGPDRRGLETQ